MLIDRIMAHSNRRYVGIVSLLLVVGGCSSDPNDSGAGGPGGGGVGGHGTAGSGGSNVGNSGAGGTSDAGGLLGSDAGTGGTMPVSDAAVGNCSPPDDIYNPIQSLSLTGCMDPKDPTKPTSRAVSYEVNSPLWSD